MIKFIKIQIETFNEIRKEAYYSSLMDNTNYYIEIFRSLCQIFVLNYYGRPMCKYFGHGKYWVDDSHGGPDHGYESGYCLRCGWGYSFKMY